jgi:hypothetical protein
MSTLRSTMVTISIAKRYLASPDTPKPIALRYLQAFERLTSGNNPLLVAEIVAAIEPACDAAHELYREIMKLVPPRGIAEVDPAQRCRDHEPAWEVISSPDTFAAFVALNPSLLTAGRAA